jgi:hypothetical protein
VAFPPGYNEDWLWCLLYSSDPQVQILRTGEIVYHDPPFIRRPTREDLVFELIGDFVFERLEEHCESSTAEPEEILFELSTLSPSPADQPSARVQELLSKVQVLINNGRPVRLLNHYGLSVLTQILQENKLEIDYSVVLADWCSDAIAKHRSMAATLRDERTMRALTILSHEGRL